MILRVHWPASGAGMQHARPPAMTLAGVEAKHPWLDARMRITGYEPIQSLDAWLDANVLLGAAVHATIQHLQVNPPTIIRFVDPGLIAIQKKKNQLAPQQNGASSSGSSNNNGPPPPAYHVSMISGAVPDVDLPRVPQQFPELDSLSRDELEELMQDDLQFRAFCNRLPIIREYHDAQRESLLKNAATAKKNLAFERELMELFATATQLQTELQTKVKAFHVLEEKQDAICKPPHVSKVSRELAKAKREAFEASERVADAWLESGSSSSTTDAFCREFVAARKVHHIRAAKLELLEGSMKQSSR